MRCFTDHNEAANQSLLPLGVRRANHLTQPTSSAITALIPGPNPMLRSCYTTPHHGQQLVQNDDSHDIQGAGFRLYDLGEDRSA